MGKLHLKRTPEEEAERRKKRRKEHKKSMARNYPEPSSVRPSAPSTARKWSSDDEDDDTDVYGPPPPPPANAPTSKGTAGTEYHSSKPDYDAIRAELEEQRFRERLFGAYDDDERLDSLEARLNDYAHVPDRWRSEPARKYKHRRLGPDDEDEFLRTDPQHLDDEEYAEWIRLGMYRKTHRDEYEEQQREKARKKERKAKEKAAKEEAKRLEKAMEEERKRRREEKENMRWGAAKDVYDSRWAELLRRDAMPPELLASTNGKDGDEGWIGTNLRFEDIPWPILAAYPKTRKRHRDAEAGGPAGTLSLDDFTSDAISRFVLTSSTSTGPSPASDTEQDKKERREKLREAMLRFHPDKFEGRVMSRVREGDKERVREAVGQVARVLNDLMG
ncbi:NF-kappa-B inhibitor-like protein 1 [Pleurotus pulmonarius]